MPDELTFDDLPPIFKECAAQRSDDEGRYAISKPWRAGGYAWATDGRIIVRMESPGPDSVGDKPWPHMASCGFNDEYETAPVPPLPVVALLSIVDAAPLEIAPGCHMAARYVCLLRLYGARLYLPKNMPGERACRFELVIDDRIEGLVMPVKPTGDDGDG